MYLTNFKESIFNQSLCELSNDKMLISCLNAYSFNLVQKDKVFQSALLKSDVILADGIAIVYAFRFLNGIRFKKISGHELFYHEMNRLNQKHGKCFFLG